MYRKLARKATEMVGLWLAPCFFHAVVIGLVQETMRKRGSTAVNYYPYEIQITKEGTVTLRSHPVPHEGTLALL